MDEYKDYRRANDVIILKKKREWIVFDQYEWNCSFLI